MIACNPHFCQSSEIRLKHTTGQGYSGLNIQINLIEFGGSRIEKNCHPKFFLHPVPLFQSLLGSSYNHLLATISRLSLAWPDLCVVSPLSPGEKNWRKFTSVTGYNLQMACDMWHVTHDSGRMWTFSQNVSFIALTVWEWRCSEDIFTNHQSAKYSVNQLQECL